MLNNSETNSIQSIQSILSVWSQAAENGDGAGVSKAIHQLKKNTTLQAAGEVFEGLKKSSSSDKSFGLSFVNQSEKDLVMQDLNSILKTIFSFYNKDSNFYHSGVGDLYTFKEL